ncbi:MAG: chorismate-binding protein [Candidatus Omnitrophota bacterium]
MQNGLEEARNELLSLIRKEMAHPKAVASFPVVVRLKIPLTGIDPLGWLLGLKNDRKVFFRSQQMGITVAGLGSCFELVSDSWHGLEELWEGLNEFISACPDARIFTGMSFARSVSGAEWDGFSAIHCMLPAVEIYQDKDGCWLAANMVRGRDGESFDTTARDILERMYLMEDVSQGDTRVLSREDVPDYEDWVCSSEAVLDAIGRGDLHKVMLARRLTLQTDHSELSVAMLKQLVRMPNSDMSFLFSINGKTFIAVKMDPLYLREKMSVVSRVVVDARGQSQEKAKREHDVVAGAVIEVYREFCRFYQIDCSLDRDKEYEDLKVSGDLNEGAMDKDFLQALHPAASVCGVPAEKARHFLQQYEVFDRGWFSGPVGFLGKMSSCIAVSSKACLFEQSALHVFVGAPFIKGSRVSSQWDVTGKRMQDILNIAHGA